MKTIVQELADLRALDATALVARYEAEFGRPPRSRNRDSMFKRLAFALQERRFGGLPKAARSRLDALVSEIELPSAPVATAVRDGLAVGSVIEREWRGRTLTLTVRDDGFEVDGLVHGSLSAAANAVTGSRWNGRLFWGVKR